MGTSMRNVLMACIAAILALATACSSPEPAPPVSSSTQTSSGSADYEQRIVTFAVPSKESGELLSHYSIVVGANTLYCSTKNDLELPLTGVAKGFSGDNITVQKFDGFIRINWDTMAARAIVVNKQQWAPIDIGLHPPLATNLRTNDWGEITSITACNWGM